MGFSHRGPVSSKGLRVRVLSEALSTLCALVARNGGLPGACTRLGSVLLVDGVRRGAQRCGFAVPRVKAPSCGPPVGQSRPSPSHTTIQHRLPAGTVIPLEHDNFSNVYKHFGDYQNTNSFKGITEFLVVFISIHFLNQRILKV